MVPVCQWCRSPRGKTMWGSYPVCPHCDQICTKAPCQMCKRI